MKLREFKSVASRRQFLEKLVNKKFKYISVYPPDLDIARTKNCENMVGAVSLPLGIAGPLLINGIYAKGSYYLPLATTEAALVASINRGAKVVTLSGGVNVFCQDVGITRGSVYKTKNIKESLKLEDWLNKNFDNLKAAAEVVSSHLKLIKTKTKVLGNRVFVRYSFSTGEAMGMNMATFASQKLADLILEKTGITCLSLAGNFDNDKKPSYLNFLEGRGKSVQAEITISPKIVREILNTTPESIHEVCEAKCHLGSMLSGSFAFNAHYANILSALFIALGQDPAHVAEGCLGITSTELNNRNLYLTVYLPDLPLGTVGGGTGLPSQSEALDILNLKGGASRDKSNKLAEIVAAGVLSGELSLLAALSNGELAKAHMKFSGNKK